MSAELDIQLVKNYLMDLQDRICKELSEADGKQKFVEDKWDHQHGAGGGRTRVLVDGDIIEKGGVNFSHVFGDELPAAATVKRPMLEGKTFQAMGVSLVIHPKNPHVPTSHMNVRFFVASAETDNPVWWFGGGFDMTPYYGYEDDVKHWHQTARKACPDEEMYAKYKQWCDDYFYLKHRNEQRGVGGLFFDDLNQLSFTECFEITKNIGDRYTEAYIPILNKRKDTPYTQAQRDWQLYRRGRYVEFNLVFDRGTLFGLQSGGRTESILMSLPPLVAWHYGYQPIEGSAEADLLKNYLTPKDWLS